MKYSHLTLDQRVVLAEKGNKKTLDELVHDEDYRVRELVANHGYRKHLDILVNDQSTIQVVMSEEKLQHVEIKKI